MKRTSATFFMLCLTSLSGCAHYCSCEENIPVAKTASVQPLPTGRQRLDECTYIKEGIEESRAFAEKMSQSRYAVYYLASSRDRIVTLEKRAKELSCP